MTQPLTQVPGGTLAAVEPFMLHTGETESKYRATSAHTGEQLTFWNLATATFWLWLVNERIAAENFRRGLEQAA